MIRTTIIATALLLTAAPPAWARDWWVLNASHGVCQTTEAAAQEEGDPTPMTPYSLEQEVRAEGTFMGLDVTRDAVGQIMSVDITASTQGGSLTVWFFTSLAGCNKVLNFVKQQGGVAGKGELN